MSFGKRSSSKTSVAVWLAFTIFIASCDMSKGSRRMVTSRDAGNETTSEDPEKTSTDPEAAGFPVNITGVYLASFENSRVRCDYIQLTSSNFKSLCTVVVAQRDGRELKALEIKDGVTLDWLSPEQVAGRADVTGCQTSKDNLAYTCHVATNSAANMVQLLFNLKISEAVKGERTESANLMLPYAVGVSAGFAPSVPFQYSGQIRANTSINLTENSSSKPQIVGFQQMKYPANQVDFSQPDSFCMRDDRLFFGNGSFIYQLQNGEVTLYAGSSQPNSTMNITHRLRIGIAPFDILCDKEAIYVTSLHYCRILRITDDGPVEIVTGGEQTCGDTPDGIQARNSAQPPLTMLAKTPSGELVFAEITGKIRKITAQGLLLTIADAGSGTNFMESGWSPITTANFISGLAIDPRGNIFVADIATQTVSKISVDGKVVRVAGTGIIRYKNRENPMALADPARLLFDADGSLLIGESFRGIKKLKSDGSLTQVISAGEDIAMELFRHPEQIRSISLIRPNFTGILRQDSGAIVTGGPRGVMRYDAPLAKPQYIVGNSNVDQACEKPFPANQHRFSAPTSLAYSKAGDLLIPDFKTLASDQVVIWAIASTGEVTYRRGLYGCDDNKLLQTKNSSAAALVGFNDIGGIAAGVDGSVYFANAQRHLILKISPSGVIQTIAGNGKAESTGDGGAATAAAVRYPQSCALGPDGAFYFVEAGYDIKTSRIRKIGRDGVITTVVGAGPAGDHGEGGLATKANIRATAIAVDAAGRLFIADQGNAKVKMVDQKGVIHTIAGGGTRALHDGRFEATAANLSGPTSLAIANDGTVYVVDNGYGVVELKPREGGKWDISVLFGQLQSGDCGTGRLDGTASIQGGIEAIKNSLAVICQGVVRAVTVHDSCPAKDGQTRIAISQNFDDYANVVEIIKPCH